MGVTNLNEYRIDFADNTSRRLMAESATSAVTAMEAGGTKQVVALNRLSTGVAVETPARAVKFSALVAPDGANVNGCKALPASWIVPENTKVIFTALPAQGYQFDGWFAEGGTMLLSTDAVSEIAVLYNPDPSTLQTVIEAHFSPIPSPQPNP